MPDRVYEGETVTVRVTWTDKLDVETDPGTCTISIYDEDEVAKVDTDTMTKVDGTEATYEYSYLTDSDAVPAGLRAIHYRVFTQATVSGDVAIGVGHFVIRNVM